MYSGDVFRRFVYIYSIGALLGLGGILFLTQSTSDGNPPPKTAARNARHKVYLTKGKSHKSHSSIASTTAKQWF